MKISRRELLGLGVVPLVVVAAGCGGDAKKADVASTEDNPVFAMPTTTPESATTPATVGTTTPAPPPTALAAPDTAVAETTPVATSPALPPGAQAVPKEGEEAYVQLGSMQIPALGIDMPLGDGVTLTNLNKGPGHWPGTAMPGSLGNSVVGGHRTSHTHPFRDLDKLNPGDAVTMTIDAGTFAYTVAGTEIVLPSDIQVLDQTDDYTGTLFACHPKGQTTHRIIVHLQLTPTPA